MIKKIFAFVSLMFLLLSMPVMANIFEINENGFLMRNLDGTYNKNTWCLNDFGCPNDGSNVYIYYESYFGEDGYMLTDTVTPDGFYVNKHGCKEINGQEVTYIINKKNKKNNPVELPIDIGDNLNYTIKVMNDYNVEYEMSDGRLFYQDIDGRTHLYLFKTDGICYSTGITMYGNKNAMLYFQNKLVKDEKMLLTDHIKNNREETFTYTDINKMIGVTCCTHFEDELNSYLLYMKIALK